MHRQCIRKVLPALCRRHVDLETFDSTLRFEDSTSSSVDYISESIPPGISLDIPWIALFLEVGAQGILKRGPGNNAEASIGVRVEVDAAILPRQRLIRLRLSWTDIWDTEFERTGDIRYETPRDGSKLIDSSLLVDPFYS